jgi:hypothetical protein
MVFRKAFVCGIVLVAPLIVEWLFGSFIYQNLVVSTLLFLLTLNLQNTNPTSKSARIFVIKPEPKQLILHGVR